MTKKEVAIKYINLLEKGEIEKVISLFTVTGVVDSPLYGTKSAKDFYTELSADTNNSELELKGIFEEENANRLALYFNYKWTLKTEEIVNFDVVDILDFDENNKISRLKIIYDTVVSRVMVGEK